MPLPMIGDGITRDANYECQWPYNYSPGQLSDGTNYFTPRPSEYDVIARPATHQ
jgi:hypothetical protein